MNVLLNNSAIDDPALWRLSILLRNGSLDVLARREVGQPEMISAHLVADPASASTAAAVEELVYANPLLLMPFRKVDIVVEGGFTLVVPENTSSDHIDKIFPSKDEAVTLSAPLDARQSLLFRLDRGVVNFFRRTFETAVPTHSLAVLTRYFSHKNRIGNSGKMYVDISENSLNILVFNHLGLAMASCFDCADINDAAYYILASAKTAALDMSNDEIRICGNTDRRAELMPLLRRFARHVVPAIFPAVFNGHPAAMSAPFPLVILPLCE